MLLLVSGAGIEAQQLAISPATRALNQKQRARGFLARRGIGPVRDGQRLSERSAAEMLAKARAQHHVLAVQTLAAAGGKQETAAITSLTAAWQPVGPAQVTTQAYGSVTGREQHHGRPLGRERQHRICRDNRRRGMEVDERGGRTGIGDLHSADRHAERVHVRGCRLIKYWCGERAVGRYRCGAGRYRRSQ